MVINRMMSLILLTLNIDIRISWHCIIIVVTAATAPGTRTSSISV